MAYREPSSVIDVRADPDLFSRQRENLLRASLD